MKPLQLLDTLKFGINNNYPILIKGAPGVGKSDIVKQACNDLGINLIISHPVVSDPTDYKGMPFLNQQTESAEFLPFGELNKLINAKSKTVFFFDDLGQAPASVQAAAMQLILAREINGNKISDDVTFIAATNRRKDKAGVQGILEPVKSRFASIVELEVDIKDWIYWAYENDMPIELTAFIQLRPDFLHDFKPTTDIINTPSPRTIANVGNMMNAGMPKHSEYELISGAAGEIFAAEFLGFLKIFRELPSIDEIIENPNQVKVPIDPSTLYALCGALTEHANISNFDKIINFLNRIPKEFQVMTVMDSVKKKKELQNSVIFTQWAIKNQKAM